MYAVEGQPAPKEEDLPNEIITKKFNSRLSLKPLNDELFDDDVVVSNLRRQVNNYVLNF